MQNNGRYTTFPQTPTQSLQKDIKTNRCQIHTSIVSMHLATRGYNKILRTALLHISSSESILHRITRRTIGANSEQINHPSSNHTYTKSTPKHIHHCCAPFVTLTYTTHIFNCTHIGTTLSPLYLWVDYHTIGRWTEKLDGGPHAGRSESLHWQGSREWVDNNNNLHTTYKN